MVIIQLTKLKITYKLFISQEKCTCIEFLYTKCNFKYVVVIRSGQKEIFNYLRYTEWTPQELSKLMIFSTFDGYII